MKKIFVLLLALVVCLPLVWSCGKNSVKQNGELEEYEDSFAEEENVWDDGKDDSSDNEWAIYWYLCGSNLESDSKCATTDLEEMMNVKLPSNVKVVVQTGGSNAWHTDGINPNKAQRFLYSSKGIEEVYSSRAVNMGNSDSLADFLSFCEENYPAEKKMLLFWNHGNASDGGVCYDEKYGNDSLSLDEIYGALESVYTLDTENPPFEVVGFDACLMATMETAYTLWDVSKYMVASEESEPGGGWDYTGWLGALAKKPSMDGKELGKKICDTFLAHSKAYGVDAFATLSVVDLSKTERLFAEYAYFGSQALVWANEYPSFVSEFARNAIRTENYGGTAPESEVYSNWVDLGHLVRNNNEYMDYAGDDLLDALEECVVYKVNGNYAKNSSGLSCYFPVDGSAESLERFESICENSLIDKGFVHLYDYMLTGDPDRDGVQFINEMMGTNMSKVYHTIKNGNYFDLEDYPTTTIVNDGVASGAVDIGPEAANILKQVYFTIAYRTDDAIYILGRDNNITYDWENGVFSENFYGDWLFIDDCPCYKEIVFEGDEYDLYSVPALVNGEINSLRVAKVHKTGEYRILGTMNMDYDFGLSPFLFSLNEGDIIVPWLYDVNQEDFVTIGEGIRYSKKTKIEEAPLGDGEYLLAFEMFDFCNTLFTSSFIKFEVSDGNIIVSDSSTY